MSGTKQTLLWSREDLQKPEYRSGPRVPLCFVDRRGRPMKTLVVQISDTMAEMRYSLLSALSR